MNYHIGTMLIDEHFDGGDECPLCKIKSVVDVRLTEQYLGEGVMEDDTRKEVNALGFCARHFDMLFASQSKLGLALQISTRLKKTIENDICPPQKKHKANIKHAENLIDGSCTCVICKYLEEHMVRYYKTVAEVYSDKPSFRKRMKECKGFCINHYAELIRYSNYAHGEKDAYLEDIYNVERAKLDKIEEQIDEFCAHHDYRNAQKPLGDAKDALKNARKTIYGNK